MKCADFVELLSSYVNDELPKIKRDFVEEHLAGCPHCRAMREEFAGIRSQLESLRQVPVVTDIREVTMFKIRESGNPVNPKRRWLRKALAAVPVIVALAVLVTWQPWAVSPAGVLARAREVVNQLDSYRIFVLKTSPSTETTATVEIEYVAPDRYHFTQTGSRLEMTYEFITIGDEAYFKDTVPETNFGTWPYAQGYSTMISREYTLQIIDYLKDLKKLPEVMMNGALCLHFSGTYDYEKQVRAMSKDYPGMGIPPLSEEQIREAVAKLQERDRKVEVELWIGKNDYLVRRLRQVTTMLDDDDRLQESVTDMRYDFTSVITIEAPRDSRGDLLPGWITTVPDFPHFRVEMQAEVDNNDPSNRRIDYAITITNTSADNLTDVDVRINDVFPGMNADIAGKVWYRWEHGQYHSGPYNLAPWKTLEYTCTFGYDATTIEPQRIADIIEQSLNSISYLQPDGQPKVELFRFEVPEQIYALSHEMPSNIVNLTPVGEYRFEEFGATYSGRGTTGEINGKQYLFVEVNTAGSETSASPGVLILDIEDPASMKKTAFIDTGDDTRYIRGATLFGTVLYVSIDDNLWVIDVSDPSAPRELTVIDGLGNNLMLISGDHAFISEGRTGIITLGLSDPVHPIQVGSLPLSSSTGIQMSLYRNYLFVKANNVFYTIDASSPASLDIVSELSFRGAVDDAKPDIEYPLYIGNWVVQGNYACLELSKDGHSAIGILDISNPSAPCQVAMYNLKERRIGTTLFVRGNTLFLSTMGSFDSMRKTRLEFIDISNPARPTEKGYGIMPESWTFFEEASEGYHQTWNLVGDCLYWFIGNTYNLPVIEIFDLSGLVE